MYTSLPKALAALADDEPGAEVRSILRKMLRTLRTATPQESISSMTAQSFPVIVVEGLDGVGKSSLCADLAAHLNAHCLRSPPAELDRFRGYFDAQPPAKRRAFYCVGNYVCAIQLRSLSSPVVLDRFWPSTAAYASACEGAEVTEMPLDLQDLMPSQAVYLLLQLSEAQRLTRLRNRGAATHEERRLEEEELRGRLMAAYREALKAQQMHEVDASGSREEVLQKALRYLQEVRPPKVLVIPVSVNWHFIRTCNYSCKFCFHTAKTSFFLPGTPEGMEESKHCLARLRDCGMQKLNFSGGEPFLQPKELGELCRYAQEELGVSVSIVSNGSQIHRSWMQKYGKYVEILAISCDSFVEETNVRIGRGQGQHLQKLEDIRDWCREFQVGFKINSVINAFNWEEDMSTEILRLQPMRWKVFQCLLIRGENLGEEALRDASRLTISEAQWRSFLKRHAKVKCLVPESNEMMVNSYLILDEHLCFLNCTQGAKDPSPSLRTTAVRVALESAGFDAEMFLQRGGVYQWTRPRQGWSQPVQNRTIWLLLAVSMAALAWLARPLARREV